MNGAVAPAGLTEIVTEFGVMLIRLPDSKTR